MIIREEILLELIMDPTTKIIGELRQGDLNMLEAELTGRAAKIKTTEDMVEQGRKYVFLILVLEKEQFGQVIGNERLQRKTPEDSGEYDDSIQVNDTAFDWSKSEKKHAQKVNEYEKFLGWKKAYDH